jgi:hypothetical protein
MTIENMSLKTNPLDFPEIVRMVGRYVERTCQVASMQVSGTFHKNVAATSWEELVVDYTNKALYSGLPSEGGRLLPWKSLELYGSHVRSVLVISQITKAPPRSALVISQIIKAPPRT